MTREVSNSDDVIDSRDVIARIEELEADISSAEEAATESGNDPSSHEAQYSEWREELAALKSLAAEAEGYAADWHHGETLIRDSYFKRYAMELADDIGAIDRNASWPCNCIDWEQAARELRMDYTAVYFDGVTYWVR